MCRGCVVGLHPSGVTRCIVSLLVFGVAVAAASAASYSGAGSWGAGANGLPSDYVGHTSYTVTLTIDQGKLSGSLSAQHNVSWGGQSNPSRGRTAVQFFTGPSSSGPWSGATPYSATVTGNGTAQIRDGANNTQHTVPSTGFVRMRVFTVADYFGFGTTVHFEEFHIISIEDFPEWKVTVSLRNKRNVSVEYQLKQNGQVVGQVTLAPGQGLIQTFTVPAGTIVEVVERIPNLFRDGDVWVVTEGAVHTAVAGDVEPVLVPGSAPPPPAKEIPPAPGVPTDVKPTSGTPERQPVWVEREPNNDPSQQKDLLTNTVYREGVEKLLAAQAAGGVGELADELAAIRGAIEAGNDAADDARGAEKDAADAASGTLGGLSGMEEAAVTFAEGAAGQGRAKAEEMVGQFGALPSVMPEPNDPGGATVQLQISKSHSLSWDLDPFSSGGPFSGALGVSAAFVRRLIAWGIVAAFFVWALARIRAMIAAPFQVAPFGKSLSDSINSVKVLGSGGGLGYAVRLTVFALLIPVVLSIPLAVMATVTAGLPWTELTTTFSSGVGGAASGLLGDALGWADKVLPWTMVISAPVWYFFVESVLFPSQFFWMMFMKFLPT